MQIIVASSNLFRRELSSYVLSEAGYTVHEANDSSALFRMINRIKPALVLLDTWLNGANELDIVRRIRQNSLIPILALMSGSAMTYKRNANPELGDDCIAWPYQAEELLIHVHTLLLRATQIRPNALGYGEMLHAKDDTTESELCSAHTEVG